MNNRLVGRVRKAASGAIEFRYDQDWLSWEHALPVSLSLPLREDPFREAVTAVFDNLLPDSDALRRRVAEKVGAAGADAYSLLVAIGRDCVGALQFLDEDHVTDDDHGADHALVGEAVDDAAIERLLKGLAQAPLGLGRDDGFRISVAGAQEKAVLLAAQILFWLIGATDGHAKNFSIFLLPGGRFHLTPLYDVLTAQRSLDSGQIQRDEMKLAMSVGKNSHDRIGEVQPRHFVETAQAAGVPKRLAQDAIGNVSARARSALDQTESELPNGFPGQVPASVRTAVMDRLRVLAA